jgi:Fe(3+) dicitrate transport protein
MHAAAGASAEVGVRGKYSDCFRIDVSIFYLQYRDRIGPLLQTRPDQSSYLFRTNLGTSIHRGVECYTEFSPLKMLQRSYTVDLSLWTSFSLLDAVYGDFPLSSPVNGKANLKGNRVEYAPGLLHRSGLSMVAGNWQCNLLYNHTSKVYSDAGNTETPNSTAQAGAIPAWTVWDASASYVFKKRYELRLNMSNLLDERYATRRSSGYPGPGLLPGEGRTLIVGIGMKW